MFELINIISRSISINVVNCWYHDGGGDEDDDALK
jgi:hypothetical protein